LDSNYRVYAYLRASTKEQDALRAKKQLVEFAKQSGLTIATFFVENESGATLNRPELFRLLQIAQPDDIILVEQIDRISRLNGPSYLIAT
jgi:DNA invertase Pin-like site-specific DNA recombinase